MRLVYLKISVSKYSEANFELLCSDNMCEEIEGWVQIGTSCCYNYYHNGTKCVQCLAGYYGTDCLKNCDPGFYGKLCVARCNCDQRFCNYEIGCLTDSTESSSFFDRGLKHSSPLYVSATFKSHSTVYSRLRPTENITISYVTSSITTAKRTNDVVSTRSKRPDIATATPSKPLDTNIYLMAIGGVIALFLGILIIQFCIKLCLKRRRYSQQLPPQRIQRSSVKEEETYQDINESLMTIGRNDNPDKHRQPGKYFELQTANQVVTSAPYDQIRSQIHYQEIAESTLVSSTSSDSNISSSSYLKPKSSKRRSFVNIVDSTSAINGTDNKDSVNENQLDKDFELQAANSLITESYNEINTRQQNNGINETHVVLSTSSGSSHSNTSYLKPTSNQRHSYIEVLDSNEIPFKENSIHESDNRTNSDCSQSSQYLDPIQDENLLENHEIGDNRDGYLDVTQETLF